MQHETKYIDAQLYKSSADQEKNIRKKNDDSVYAVKFVIPKVYPIAKISSHLMLPKSQKAELVERLEGRHLYSEDVSQVLIP